MSDPKTQQFMHRIQELTLENGALDLRLQGQRMFFSAAALQNNQAEMSAQRAAALAVTEQVFDNLALVQMLTRQIMNRPLS